MRAPLKIGLMVLGVAAGAILGGALATHQRVSSLRAAFQVETGGAPGAENTPPRTPFSSEEEAISAVFSALQERNQLRRAFDIYEALQRLDSKQLAAMAGRVAPLTDYQQRAVLLPLMQRWSQIDPEAAEAWAQPYLDRFVVSGGPQDRFVATAWSRAAPERALEKALRIPDENTGAQIAAAAVAGLAGDDPKGAVERLAQLPEGKLRERALADSIRLWAAKEPAAAYAQLGRLAPGRLADEVRRGVMHEWAKSDPNAALGALEELGPSLRAELHGNPLVREVIGAAASKDPQVALEAVERLPDALQRDATTAAIVAWARKDGVAALEWARSHGISLEARSYQRFGGGLGFSSYGWNSLLDSAMNSDKEKVIEWVRALPAGEERSRGIAEIIRHAPMEQARELFTELPPERQKDAVWSFIGRARQDDPDATADWVRNLPPGPVRTSAVNALVSSSSHGGPEKIEEVIQDFAPGPDRDAALWGAVSGTAYRKPHQALEFATRIQERRIRERAFEQLASSWFYQDRAAAAAWLAQTQEITPENKRVILRQAEDHLIEWGR